MADDGQAVADWVGHDDRLHDVLRPGCCICSHGVVGVEVHHDAARNEFHRRIIPLVSSDLPFHKAGYLICTPLGRVMTILGGTLGQILLSSGVTGNETEEHERSNILAMLGVLE